jgi:hypothetical protein
MSEALQNHDIKRLEVIGFRGCAKSTMASLALVLWAALEHPDKYPFIIMLAGARGILISGVCAMRSRRPNIDPRPYKQGLGCRNAM